MEKKVLLLLGAMMLAVEVSASGPSRLSNLIQEDPFTSVHLSDGFWSPHIETNRTVSIPSAFHECKVNGRFDNFALAAGLIQSEHKGDTSTCASAC